MSSLDNLTSKILKDAEEKAADIIKNAKKQAEEKKKASMKKISEKKEILLESTARERELLSERIKSGAVLKARNEKLRAKQAVIQNVIDRLKEKLVNMDESDYIDYLVRNIDVSSFNSTKRLIVKKDYAGKVRERFPGLKVAEDEFVDSGFVIEENGIQDNYTFEVKLDFLRDELEVEISRLLF